MVSLLGSGNYKWPPGLQSKKGADCKQLIIVKTRGQCSILGQCTQGSQRKVWHAACAADACNLASYRRIGISLH